MTDAEALLRAVLADPLTPDDLPRLVYADALEEAGRGPHAAFIRVQCEAEAQRRVAIKPSPENDLRQNWLNREQQTLLYDLGRMDSSLYDPEMFTARGVTYRRGFVDSVVVTAAEFVGHETECAYCAEQAPDHETNTIECGRCDSTGVGWEPGIAKDLFNNHPVTRVTLAGAEPRQMMMSPTLLQNGWWYWWSSPTPPTEPDADALHLVPEQLMDLMLGLPEVHGNQDEDHRGGRYASYRTRELALDVLSWACVTYGRRLAGLPGLKPPEVA